MLAVHQGLEPPDDVGLLRGDVLRLRGIRGEIEEFGRLRPLRLLGAGRLANRLPATVGHGLPLPLREFAVQEAIGRRCRLALEGRRQAHAVATGGDLVVQAGQVEERRHPVLEASGRGERLARRDSAGPRDRRRHPQASLVGRTLPLPKVAVAPEPVGIEAATSGERRPVVTREHEDRVVGQPQFLEQRDDPAHLPVHPRDHRRVGRKRPATGHVAPATEIGLLRAEVCLIVGQRGLIGRHLEREVGHRGGHVEEERPRRVTADEGELLGGDQVGRILLAGELREGCVVSRRRGRHRAPAGHLLVAGEGCILEPDLVAVAPEMAGIEGVGLPLAVVAVEPVEAAGHRIRHAPRRAQPPLAEATGGVASVVEDLRERERAGRHGELPLGLHLAVAADHRVARMLAGHQHAAARRADGVARPVPGEPGPAGEEGVDVRRLDVLAAERADVARAEIVAEEEHDVGGTRARGGRGAEKEARQDQGEQRQSVHGDSLRKSGNRFTGLCGNLCRWAGVARAISPDARLARATPRDRSRNALTTSLFRMSQGDGAATGFVVSTSIR